MKLKYLLFSVFFIPSLSYAAGYQLNEFSAVGLGRAFSGMGISGDDYSALAYNPAGMNSNKTNGGQVVLSAVRVFSDFKGYSNKYDPSSRGYGNTNIVRFMPSGFAQYKVNDKVTAGIGLYTPYGLATDYDDDWFGEMHGKLSAITTMNLSPAFAYQIHDKVSVGAALNIQYSTAHLTSSSSNIKGDDFAFGTTVGITVKPIDSVQIGVSYRSRVQQKLKGDIIRPEAYKHGSVSAEITTPESALLSLGWDVNDKWHLSGTARWTRWNRFDTLAVKLKADGLPTVVSSTDEKWRNTGFYSLGADYHLNKEWTLRGGVGYDMTVIRDQAHRTPRIPDGRRLMTSLGASYAYQNLSFDFGYAHIFIWGGHAKGTDNINTAYHRVPDIKYSSYADTVAFGMQYHF